MNWRAALPFRALSARRTRAVLGAALDLVLPRLRAACREPVEGQGLCPACWSKLSFITRPYCQRLGIPLSTIRAPASCPWRRSPIRRPIIAPAPRRHFARLVHGLKYSDRLDLVPMMGRRFSHAGGEVLAAADALIPVLLHWRWRWARRFDQSAMLAAAVSVARVR
jgi:predicted amidophosphoribosyltransferase